MTVYIIEERADENITRNRIYRFIYERPGTHFSAIKRALNLENGVLQYHLDVLVKTGRVKYTLVGNRKIFFPSGYTPKNVGQRAYIINEIRHRYGLLSQKEQIIFDSLVFDGAQPLDTLMKMAKIKNSGQIRAYLKNIEKKMGIIIKLYHIGNKTYCSIDLERYSMR